jgi:hypothetical protein
MKIIYTAVLITVSGLAIHLALGASSPDRPTGIEGRNWIPLSDKMGFVDTSPHPFPPADVMLAPPTEGYFVIRNRNGWHRIVIQNPLKGPGTAG